MKRTPHRADRRTISVGRAKVNWGPQTYGKPNVVASAPVEAIDDLVAAILQARIEINDGDEPSRDETNNSVVSQTDQHAPNIALRGAQAVRGGHAT